MQTDKTRGLQDVVHAHHALKALGVLGLQHERNRRTRRCRKRLHRPLEDLPDWTARAFKRNQALGVKAGDVTVIGSGTNLADAAKFAHATTTLCKTLLGGQADSIRVVVAADKAEHEDYCATRHPGIPGLAVSNWVLGEKEIEVLWDDKDDRLGLERVVYGVSMYEVRRRCGVFQQRRDLLLERFAGIDDLLTPKPEGAFYLWMEWWYRGSVRVVEDGEDAAVVFREAGPEPVYFNEGVRKALPVETAERATKVFERPGDPASFVYLRAENH